MAYKVTELTEDQEFLMAEVKEEWIKRALLSGDRLNDKAAREGLEWLYALSGKKKPITILLDSPLALQYGANILAGTVGDQVRGQVRGQVYDQVSGQVYGQVRGQVYDQVSDQVSGQVRDQKLTAYYFAYEDLAFASGWVAFYDYFEKIGVVKHKAFKRYKKMLKSGIFMTILFENVALACRRPKAVRRDDQGRLHSDQKPAIEWRDGYKLYYLHGQHVNESLWKRIVSQEMTLKDIMDIRNADERTMAFSMLRPDRLLEAMNAKLIHTGIKGTKLYQVDDFAEKVLGDTSRIKNSTEYCMVMQDASTDRVFLEWVDPKIGQQEDADLAQATALQIPLEDYLSIPIECEA